MIVSNKMMFPVSKVIEFENHFKAGDYGLQRYGQAFYGFMGLDKCVAERFFCDTLYTVDGLTAKRMVDSRTDYNS